LREWLSAQLFTQPIAIGDVQPLQLFEPQEQRQRLRRIMAVAQKPGGERAWLAICRLFIAMYPSACARRCSSVSRSVGRELSDLGGGAIRIGGVTIESKDRMLLSLFRRREHAPLSATDA
jgi:hypothetical protein